MFSFLPMKVIEKFFPYMAACKARRREARYAERVARRRQIRYVRLTLEGLEERVVPATDIYSGPFGGAWADPTDWTLGRVPGSADVAVIPGGSYCILNSTTDQTVAGLTVNGQLDVGSKLSVTTANTAGIFNVLPGGEVDVLGSADLGGGGVINGHIDAQGSSVTFDPGSSMVLATGANLTGSLFNIFGAVTCTAALSQEANIVLDADGVTTFGSLTGSGSLSDSGEFDWDGGVLGLSGGMDFIASADLKIQGANGKGLTAGTLTNQCNGSEIGGTGTLSIGPGATFDNLGNPNCDVTISSITVQVGMSGTGAFINDADGIFTEQGTTSITGNFINLGYLEIGAGTALTLSSDGPAGPDSMLDGTLLLDGDLTLLGEVSAPTGFKMGPGGGTLKVGDGTAGGSLVVAGGYEALITGGTLEVTSTGTLTGAGTLDNNSGIVQLDVGSSTTGLGAFIQTPSGQLTLQAGAMGAFSTLAVTGDASLGGTLNLDFVDGFTPSPGYTMTALTAGSITHQFNVTPPDMTATYGPTSVTLTK